jgi:hypothetical protein
VNKTFATKNDKVFSMNSKGGTKLLLSTAIASVFGATASNALALDAAEVFTNSSGTAVTYNNASGSYPVVTAILSVPGVTVNGYSYSATSGTFLAADSSGSLEIYDTPSGTYTPTLGDGLLVTGTYSPFDEIPELKVSTTGTVTVESTGNASPAGASTFSSPINVTLSQIDSGTVAQQYGAQLLEINNASISGATAGTTYGTADETYTITDASGSTALFYYPHDFSVANQNLFGATVDQSDVDVIGLVDSFDGSTEFLPLQVTVVPEPATLALAGLGGLSMLFLRRRNA